MRQLILLWALIAMAGGPLQAAEPPASFKVSEYTFQRPATWRWVPTASPMRKAQLEIVTEAGKGEVIFFNFGPGQGGGAKANVDRWLGQFEEPREKLGAVIEEATHGARKVTYVRAEGTYLSGMPGGPKTALKGHGLLGAIVPSEQGDTFIRLTGPAALVKAAQADFKKMVGSAFVP